jgi:hypothetical protein
VEDTARACRPDGSSQRLHRYELRVRTTLSRALAASILHRVDDAIVPRHTEHRLAIGEADENQPDLPAVVKRLAECDVDILDVRMCTRST